MNYIYKITNIINNKVYIGQHTWQGEGLDPDYLCSSSNPHFWNAVEKYGIENFTKEIIEIVDDASMLSERETYWIQQYFGVDCYNLNPTGGGWGHINSNHELRVELNKKANETNRKNKKGFCYDMRAHDKTHETCKKLGIGFCYNKEIQKKGGKIGGTISAAHKRENGEGFFDPALQKRATSTRNRKFNYYYNGELIYTGRACSAKNRMNRLGQVWIQGELVED